MLANTEKKLSIYLTATRRSSLDSTSCFTWTLSGYEAWKNCRDIQLLQPSRCRDSAGSDNSREQSEFVRPTQIYHLILFDAQRSGLTHLDNVKQKTHRHECCSVTTSLIACVCGFNECNYYCINIEFHALEVVLIQTSTISHQRRQSKFIFFGGWG